MTNYIYDGTFEGLLTAVYEVYYRHESPSNIASDKNIQQSLLDNNVHIVTDEYKASKVYTGIREKISSHALRNAYHAFLSELSSIELDILKYLRFGFKEGRKVDLYLSDERVLRVHSAARKVRGESHRILGLLRFKQLTNDVYYAQYSPDHNITALISNHFARRLSDQNWIIHDLKRNCAAIFDKSNCILVDLVSDLQISSIKESDIYEKLWKNYFKSICIKERINPRLQRQNMPMRYWKFLTEKQL